MVMFNCRKCEGVIVGPRKSARKVTLKGILAGAKVCRSVDWTWGDQDGGAGKVGKVLSVEDYKNTFRSVVNVKWQTGEITNIYRLGYVGKVDIQATEMANHRTQFYVDHLPVLGKQQSLSVRIGIFESSFLKVNA